MNRDELKRMAAERAVAAVKSGMVVGLGHGTTAAHAIRLIAERVKAGELTELVCIPCSKHVAGEAEELGLPLGDLSEYPVVDMTIDGADEVDPDLNVIKGGGGALLREKIVAQATRREVIIVDDGKLSGALGTKHPVPVEVFQFGCRTQVDWLRSQGADATLRRGEDGEPYLTDQGNWIIDCDFGPIEDVEELAVRLCGRTGILAHGLFVGLVSEVIVASEAGVRVQRGERQS